MSTFQSIADIDFEAIAKTIAAFEGWNSPWIRIDKKNRLFHTMSFDLDVIEDVIKSVTDQYTVAACKYPKYMRCIEIEDETNFNTVAVALKFQFRHMK